MIWAVVPVKDFHTAKQRLSHWLSPEQRRELAAAMLSDVLRALGKATGLDQIVLVTREPQAIATARAVEALVIDEPFNQGESAAVDRAVARAVGARVRAIIVIPGDVPLVSPDDVTALVEAGERHQVVLVPSRDERGSNGIWLCPPDALPLCFGSDSFRLHRQRAQARNLSTLVLRRPNLALDVDTADDLHELALHYGSRPELAAGSETAAFLHAIRWPQRFRSSGLKDSRR